MTKEERKVYTRNWMRKNIDYNIKYRTNIKVDENKIGKYKLIKEYENYVLMEHKKYGFKECFSYLEYEQIKGD